MKLSFSIGEMKELSAALIKGIKEEHFWNHDAAAYLNKKTSYISSMQRIKSFHAVPDHAWERVKEWKETGLPISEFRIPFGEPRIVFEIRREHVVLPPAAIAESVESRKNIEALPPIEKKAPTPKPVKPNAEHLARIEEAMKERNRFFIQKIDDLLARIELAELSIRRLEKLQ